MTDIHWLWQGLSAGQEASPNMRHAANTAMMGLIFMNSYAGRPGEWASLTRAKVEECLSSGQSFVAMDDHKTAVEYGTLGRHVSAGNAILQWANFSTSIQQPMSDSSPRHGVNPRRSCRPTCS
jgi:hypothetical protein